MLKKLMTAGVLPGTKKRNKKVSGAISVYIPNLSALLGDVEDAGYFERVDLLVETLKEADAKNQWRDPDPGSFHFISAALSKEDNRIILYFRPDDPLVTSGQTHAYQKYVERVCSVMDKMLSRSINGVFRMTLTPSVTIGPV